MRLSWLHALMREPSVDLKACTSPFGASQGSSSHAQKDLQSLYPQHCTRSEAITLELSMIDPPLASAPDETPTLWDVCASAIPSLLQNAPYLHL